MMEACRIWTCGATRAAAAAAPERRAWLDELTPRQIVSGAGQVHRRPEGAKRAVAIALRNRWRRQRVDDDLREEIMPNNIILIGPTGVGKTEIARRLARLAGAPFVKVEASKFTEVGYVGRDVESMVRDLVDVAVNMVRDEREATSRSGAAARSRSGCSTCCCRPRPSRGAPSPGPAAAAAARVRRGLGRLAPARRSRAGAGDEEQRIRERRERTREKLRTLLRDGKLEERKVDIEVQQSMPPIENMMLPMGGRAWTTFTEMLQDMMPKRKKRRTVTVAEARRILLQDELDKLVDMDEVVNEALERTEDMGIIFLDEIDKIAGERAGSGPDVSREGVQRDLLPIVEGSTVQTKYGMIRTDHILFIAAGAFHVAKPSDLIPELQGRFPIRVELKPLTEADFVRILQEPKNALCGSTRRSSAPRTSSSASPMTAREIARIAAEVNREDGEHRRAPAAHRADDPARRDPVRPAREVADSGITIDADTVRDKLRAIVEDEDLRKYIL
jgi:ATP-dependent HslUV protease ATP-binding subunit HslU